MYTFITYITWYTKNLAGFIKKILPFGFSISALLIEIPINGAFINNLSLKLNTPM